MLAFAKQMVTDGVSREADERFKAGEIATPTNLLRLSSNLSSRALRQLTLRL